MAAAEHIAARGIIAGLIVGAAVGLIVLAFGGGEMWPLLSMPPAAIMVATILSGATVGVFVGSLFGLPGLGADEG